MAKRWCEINWNYIPIKAHYFFLFGGLGGTVPFMQILGKDLGISATAVGIVYTAVPLCVFLSKPIFGFVADLFRNIKLIIILLVTVTTIAFLLILLVPAIEENRDEYTEVATSCTEQSDQLSIFINSSKAIYLQKDYINFEVKTCQLKSDCFNENNITGTLNISSNNFTQNISLPFTLPSEIHLNCSCMIMKQSFIRCEYLSFAHTSQETATSIFVYGSYNFWLFALLSIISGAGSATLYCLSDAACYEVLGENPKLYGRQRLWGTLSWGIASSATGYMNDIATGSSKQTNYSPGFYLLLSFMIVDIIILSKMTLVKAKISTHICKDVSKIYTSWLTIIFSFAVYICGSLSGLLWSYEFWYLTDLGASQTLLGLVLAVQCFIAEIPLFFFSEWFIITFGHFSCIIMALAAFALRTGFYVLLQNPWLVLPIEVLHGFTFAIFYTAMTLFAADYGPPGTEATMLGVLGGLFEGLGVATGTLLGGIGFDKFGGRQTFFVACMLSIACVIFFSISFYLAKLFSEKRPLSRKTTADLNNYNAAVTHAIN